ESLKEAPTHIFLQAGVGSMAGALASFFAQYYDNRPIITIIEPNNADCIFRTARANDGELHAVTGSLKTIMAGLACGVPCTVAWELLKSHAENYISMPDYVAAEGMRILGNPLGDDERIISGESGASTAGFVCELMRNNALDYIRETLNADGDSRVLCFSTEGDTDRENYRRIVWDGLYQS
ncbi:MAG: pyridoxal-phosphate dependent enzyme, partial [Synergistaceae bacterium]|nr:pyridoxal-phosphate dependent enzyme [Synergistaceae bacterium]